MNYTRFEDLPAWRMSIELALRTLAFTQEAEFGKLNTLREQLERSVIAVSTKVAEAFERVQRHEALSCLSTARGAVAEARSLLCLIERMPALAEHYSELANLKSMAESVGRRLHEAPDTILAHATQQAGPAPAQAPGRPARDERKPAKAAGSNDFLKQLTQIQEMGGPQSP